MLAIVGCLEHSDNGIQTDAAVLMLVARVAAAPFTAKQLLHLGAERLLQELQIQRSTELQPLITAALSALLSAPNLAVSAYVCRVSTTWLAPVLVTPHGQMLHTADMRAGVPACCMAALEHRSSLLCARGRHDCPYFCFAGDAAVYACHICCPTR